MNTTFMFLFIIFLLIPAFIFPQIVVMPSVTIEKLPKTIEEFVTMRDGIAKSQQGGAATFLVALIVFTMDRDLGMKCLTIALDQELLTTGDVFKGYKPSGSVMSLIESQIVRNNRAYVTYSYVKGATPANQYKLPDSGLTFEFVQNSYSEQSDGSFKVFVKCSGADSPRPIIVRKNNRGIWKAWNINSVLVGVRPPEVEKDDDL